jgi:hypothetical protein
MMMKNQMLIAAVIALTSGTTVSAATDPGLSVPGAVFQRQNSGGVGAQLGVRIKLGSDRIVRDVDRVAIGVAAGPNVSVRDVRAPSGFRSGIAPIASFTLNPGFGAQAKLIGQPVLSYQTRLGLAEDARTAGRIDPKQKQGISTLGVVGIVAGVAVVGYLGLVAFICRDGCSE